MFSPHLGLWHATSYSSDQGYMKTNLHQSFVIWNIYHRYVDMQLYPSDPPPPKKKKKKLLLVTTYID